jgi:hypothetical protein
VVLPVPQAVPEFTVGPFVVSSAAADSTPVNDVPQIARAPGVEAEYVAVIVVPEASPDGACADTIATLPCPAPPMLP